MAEAPCAIVPMSQCSSCAPGVRLPHPRSPETHSQVPQLKTKLRGNSPGFPFTFSATC